MSESAFQLEIYLGTNRGLNFAKNRRNFFYSDTVFK